MTTLPPCAHTALLTLWTRQEEHLGASLPTPSSVPYQGFLPAGLTSCWTLGLALPRMGPGWPFSLPGRRVPARVVTHLAPRQYWALWTWVGRGVSGTFWGEGLRAGRLQATSLPPSQPHVLQP
uniref:Uncharacterized protein n=1 Tax=Molossus molossus TaxID=27622 RepID=A0A7J8C8R9_MOLMO|nr:hypothetical protein HJG59_009891 [Molossus molossus]